MTPSRRAWPLALLLACGCTAKQGPAIHLAIAHGSTGDGRCSEAGADDPAVSSSGASVVRLSIRKHGHGDPTGSFLCDKLLNDQSSGRTDVKLAVKGQAAVDIYAEAFSPATDGNSMAGSYRRVATGSLLNVDLTDKTFGPIRLYPVQSFRCVGSKMAQPRGFHTATPLPNGQVLFLGGLTGDSTGTMDAVNSTLFFATGGAEIYDPSDGTFRALPEASPTPRAFHQAFYLGDDGAGTYKVMLVGGVTSTDGTTNQPILGVTNSGVGGPRLVPFNTSSTIPSPLPAVGAGAELVEYNSVTGAMIRTPVDGFDPAAFLTGASLADANGNADGFVVAGGVNYVDPLESTMPTGLSIRVERGMETMPRLGDLTSGRLGASLVQLADDNAILWGGGLTGGAAQAEIITGLNAANMPMSRSLDLASAPSTQFQTATLIDAKAGTILVTGGFSVDASGNAQQPPTAAGAVQLVTTDVAGLGVTNAAVPFGGTYVPDASTCNNAARYRPAGWESAITLPRGRGILVTGGAPTFDTTRKCNDCESGSSPTTLLCSSRQASVFANGEISPAADVLQVGRFGHTSTLLADGTVLIAGGVTLPPGGATQVRMAPDAEIYNPVTSVPPVDVTAAMPVDTDDPLAVDLAGAGLLRVPGGLAYTSDPKVPAHRCGSL